MDFPAQLSWPEIQIFPLEWSHMAKIGWTSEEQADTDTNSSNSKHGMQIWSLEKTSWSGSRSDSWSINASTLSTRSWIQRFCHWMWHVGREVSILNSYWYLAFLLVGQLPSHQRVVWMVVPHGSICTWRLALVIPNRIPAVQANLETIYKTEQNIQKKVHEWI